MGPFVPSSDPHWEEERKGDDFPEGGGPRPKKEGLLHAQSLIFQSAVAWSAIWGNHA